MIQWRRQPEWRGESGPGYDLRQYVGGRPTGLVATTAWQAPRDESAVAGPDVWLVRAPTHVVIGEYRNRGEAAARWQIPLRSCVDAVLADEPGLPGNALVRLTLTVRFGPTNIVAVSLWFRGDDRPFVAALAHDVNSRTAPAPTPTDQLPLLEVTRAPDDNDWVAFRPGPCSDDVLRPGEGER